LISSCGFLPPFDQERRELVSRRQYGFLIGFLFVWLAWAASWVVLGAVAAGLLGYLVVRVLEGDLGFDMDTVTDRFRDQTRR
jgi:hypothetical protein